MTDLVARLQAALGDAYHLERELGGGGMSRVFLATDVSLRRAVVIKVLPPEFASEVNEARFRQEIELAAHLQHPHILPVLTAGAKDDLLFYVMPFVSGESLRHRLTREGKFAVADALRVLHEMADALAYAHAEGVIHRDVKPENILLEGNHAVLTDFGVARALAESRSGGRLTDTGVSVGSPAYMSPEQAAGERDVDARADVYALAVVGYEMLAGAPPFVGPTAQALIAAHLTATPRPLGDVRPETPMAMADGIMRALAKDPGVRLRTAAEFRDALAGAVATVVPTRPAWRASLAALGVVVVIIGGAAVVWQVRNRQRELPLDPNVVAVLPFRVTGAEPSLGYLREGMVDLLAAKLTGEGGPRAADSRTVLAAWRRAGGTEALDLPQNEDLTVARRLGAGQLLLGEVVGTHISVVISGSLVGVPGGRSKSQANVAGSPDSLPALIDRLAAGLLAGEAGEVTLAARTTGSLPALQVYLAGKAAYRRGRYNEAYAALERALQLDSTFALAALALVTAGEWLGPAEFDRARTRALAARDRLVPRDRAVLDAFAVRGAWALNVVAVAAAESATAVAPDRPEAWYLLGDVLFHFGPLLGRTDGQLGATPEFRRALELDPDYSAVLGHLLQVTILGGDTAQVRRLAARYFATDSTGELADLMRWRVAVALDDTSALRGVHRGFDEMSLQSLARIVGYAQLDGVDLDAAEHAAAAARRRASTTEERRLAIYLQHDLALNRGRPSEALRLTDEWRAIEEKPLDGLKWRMADAIEWGGDSLAAREAAREIASFADRPLAADAQQRALQFDRLCWLEIYRVWRGENVTVPRAIARLRSAVAPRDAGQVVRGATTCALAIEAMLASAERRPEATAATERFDSLMRLGPAGPAFTFNLIVARLRERQGDLRSALAAVRRRPYFHDHGPIMLAVFLREEGRLAALTGDREGAIRAYQHYVALRSNPEPSLRPDVDGVRAELARLLAERTRNH